MQYQVVELPTAMSWVKPHEGSGRYVVKVLRHWVVTADGQFWFQDETLLAEYGGNPLPSHRTKWERMESPPIEHTFVGICEWDGIPFVMRSDGKAFVFGQQGEDALPHWHPVHEPAPRR